MTKIEGVCRDLCEATEFVAIVTPWRKIDSSRLLFAQ
jgi:hypothetical protein